MTPSSIEPATFRFVAQYLKHCATAINNSDNVKIKRCIILIIFILRVIMKTNQYVIGTA